MSLEYDRKGLRRGQISLPDLLGDLTEGCRKKTGRVFLVSDLGGSCRRGVSLAKGFRERHQLKH